MEEPNLISDAANIRDIYLNKPFPKGNIAIIEVRLEDGKAFGMGATSRGNRSST
jgi:filamentous hemagglutinin